MTDAIARLTAGLADRYAIERELGAGGGRSGAGVRYHYIVRHTIC